MNPPSGDADGDELSPYRGAERLDVALADRFAFVCTVPTWGDLSAAEQEGVLLKSSGGIAPMGAAALSNAVAKAFPESASAGVFLADRDPDLTLAEPGRTMTPVLPEGWRT